MAEIFGTFILTANDGKYEAEFFNNKMKAFCKEEVRKIEVSPTNEFVGNFDVTWNENSGSCGAVMQIDLESEHIYMLKWTDVELNGELQNMNFSGRGVVRNGILVAVYSMNALH